MLKYNRAVFAELPSELELALHLETQEDSSGKDSWGHLHDKHHSPSDKDWIQLRDSLRSDKQKMSISVKAGGCVNMKVYTSAADLSRSLESWSNPEWKKYWCFLWGWFRWFWRWYADRKYLSRNNWGRRFGRGHCCGYRPMCLHRVHSWATLGWQSSGITSR